MKIHFLFKDRFIQGSDLLINELLLKYNLLKIDLNELFREYTISKSITEIDINSKSNLKASLLASKLTEHTSHDLLIIGFDFDYNQISSILSEFSKYNYTIENIWYFQAINILDNLKKVDKYKIVAEREDPTFAHIKKAITSSQLSNLNMIKLLDKYEKLCIYNIESYGKENSQNSIERIIKQL